MKDEVEYVTPVRITEGLVKKGGVIKHPGSIKRPPNPPGQASSQNKKVTEWINAKDQLPKQGDLIVGYWEITDTYWAGVYWKENLSFDKWMKLTPAENSSEY